MCLKDISSISFDTLSILADEYLHRPLIYSPLNRVDNEGPDTAYSKTSKKHRQSFVPIRFPGDLQSSSTHLGTWQQRRRISTAELLVVMDPLGLNPCFDDIFRRRSVMNRQHI